jgi:hypothetical protein
VIKDNHLKALPSSLTLFAEKGEHLANGRNIFILPFDYLRNVGLVADSSTFRKINLARLVIDQKPRHRSVGFAQKEFLKRERQGYMVS